jgi:hypothetical protein
MAKRRAVAEKAASLCGQTREVVLGSSRGLLPSTSVESHLAELFEISRSASPGEEASQRNTLISSIAEPKLYVLEVEVAVRRCQALPGSFLHP